MTLKLTSDFAFLDVKDGRHDLAIHFATRPRIGECPVEMRIPITIVGYIDGQASQDDGVSIEFTIIVEHLITAEDVKDLENFIEAEHRMSGLQVKARTALKKLKGVP